MELVLTDQNFEADVLNSKGKFVIDFWAPWYGPCQIICPILDNFAKDLPANLRVGKLNVDENPQTAQKYNIMSIPTLVVIENGKVVKQVSGVQSKESLHELIA